MLIFYNYNTKSCDYSKKDVFIISLSPLWLVFNMDETRFMSIRWYD